MTTATVEPRPSPPHPRPLDTVPDYLNVDYGVRSWLLTTDHKRIALLYLVSITLMFFLGGVFAALIRLELATPEGRPGRRPTPTTSCSRCTASSWCSSS